MAQSPPLGGRAIWARLSGGVFALTAAVVLAAAVSRVQAAFPDAPERAVAATGVFCLCVGVLGLAVYAAARRRRLSPGELSLAAFAMAGMVLGGIYLFWASASVFQRADILIWSESPFVNDIIKFRIGAPLYGNPADFDSFFYTPGSQLLTYGLATIAGAPTSIPAYRIIQLGYAALAVLLTASATWRLVELAGIRRREEPAGLWAAVLTVLSFLAAGNAITNPFTYLLHNDALSLLISAATFRLLIEYAATRRISLLVALSVMPAAGFLVKQSLAFWAVLIVGYLVVFDRPRGPLRSAAYALAAFGSIGASYGAGVLAWGHPFHYWVVTGLGSHAVSLLRGAQHALDAWTYFAAGLAAGALVLGSRPDSRLLGLWLVWVALLASETYTSGIAWMLNHMGPGSLLAMPWLGALLVRVWPVPGEATWRTPSSWWRPAMTCLCAVMVLNGLGAVRIPLPSMPRDITRYTAAIAAETEGVDLSRVLIDQGSWLYFPAGIVMKDRMAAIGETGYSQTGDFSGFLRRISTHYYARILVHDLDGADFQYDHFLWKRSSGIRAALKEHYTVVRTIPGVEGQNLPWLKTISVLEPRADQSAIGVGHAGK